VIEVADAEDGHGRAERLLVHELAHRMHVIEQRGRELDGLRTIGAPAAIAVASLCATWLSGWLNAVIAATSLTACAS
jgi:hypothetical protein